MTIPMAILDARLIDIEIRPLPDVETWSWTPQVQSISKLREAMALSSYTKRQTNLTQVDGGEGQ